jgi:hypothetical protein
MRYALQGLTFGPNLELLGYDLAGEAKGSAEGVLFVTLYWLNQDATRPVEAQIQALAEDGSLIDEQTLPVPPPAKLSSWQSVSYYQLSLSALPALLKIRAKLAGGETWYQLQALDRPTADALLIEDILSKTSIVAK